MLLNIKNYNFLKILFFVSLFLSFCGLLENKYDGEALDIASIVKFETTFLLIFFPLASIFVIFTQIDKENKKPFCIFLVLSLIIYSVVSILYSPFSIIISLYIVLLQSSFIGICIFFINNFLKKSRMRILFYLMLSLGMLIVAYSRYLSYTEVQTYNKEEEFLYNDIGTISTTFSYYNTIGKAINSEMNRDSLRTMAMLNLQEDIDIIFQDEYYLNLLIGTYFCTEWKIFRKESEVTFKNTEIIDKRCSYF